MSLSLTPAEVAHGVVFNDLFDSTRAVPFFNAHTFLKTAQPAALFLTGKRWYSFVSADFSPFYSERGEK